MNEYVLSVLINVTVEAPDAEDAIEAMEDCFGDCGGVVVNDLEVLDIAELT